MHLKFGHFRGSWRDAYALIKLAKFGRMPPKLCAIPNLNFILNCIKFLITYS